MYTLRNDELTVMVMDPVADQAHLGTRYCTGGYIYQIEDNQRGPLLAGPDYPGPFSPFNGQGIPDAFNLSPLRELNTGEGPHLILGVGLCDLHTEKTLEPCDWQITSEPDTLSFRTEQAMQGWALTLERRLTLTRRTVRSWTRVTNTGRAFLPLRWFPHPFFPPPAGDEFCRLNVPVSLRDNPGYELAPNGFIRRRAGAPPEGCFLALEHEAQSNLTVLQRHPVLGLVAGTCSYVPAFFPIWGNRRTFSWEPYFERMMAAGQTMTWWIDYDF
ncbi:MAG: hypothetical protein IT317_05560 [Anaerolineales bacterium]|nr:hypothetical protein [Anaerolineales bacterium]